MRAGKLQLSGRLPHLGSLWMLVAAIGFGVMGALVKLGSPKFSNAELVFYRSIFGLISIYGYIAYHKLPLRTPVLGKQVSRAVVGLISLALFFYAIAHLPLATAITLNYTSALFLAALTPFLLHEKPKPILLGTILLGFLGIALLLKPSFSSQNMLAGALGLLSGFGASMAYVHVKQLGALHEPDWRTVFYFTCISTVISGLWMLFDHFSALAWQDLPLLLGLGVSATIGQLAMTRAYRTGNTLIVASLAYTTVIFATLLGVIFWQETLSASEYIAIGMIILSGMISVNTTTQKKSTA
ncbi:DMT family transporter [Methylotenera sp. 1P/1]|uniref:DMT family transporter n=1 Tax=Methylotenera sp. 1P/1 TaxID=1131551 RepID=UPI000378885F|nr:DMT family transporter [Methylotenera sp. 1P/1]